MNEEDTLYHDAMHNVFEHGGHIVYEINADDQLIATVYDYLTAITIQSLLVDHYDVSIYITPKAIIGDLLCQHSFH